MRPIEQSCFWLATRGEYRPSPCLSGDTTSQVAVVGGGFTGLWTALFLKQLDSSLDVVLVEQGTTGYGASGRNAGMISACVDHTHSLAVTHFGRDEAIRLARIGFENIDEMQAFGQGCDFERTGQLQVALTPAHVQDCKENLELAQELGFEGYRFLSQEETQAEINSPLYLSSLWVPGGGIVNPIKLVQKIKAEAEKLGVRFFENTKVVKVAGGKVECESGSVSAPKIILATDAYTHHLFPELLWRFIPLYDYILVSEPLTEKQKDAIRWKNRQGVVDGRTFFNYYRLTDDNRVLWGTSEAVYYPPNRVDESCDHSERHYQELRASFARHFPDVTGLEFPYAWGGPIASTTRMTPFFGTLDSGRVIYALGYTGHGLGSTRIAGKVLAHMATAKHCELLDLSMVKNKPFPYPPEPMRSLAVKAVTHSLQRVDQGHARSPLLRILDALGLGFSS